MKRLRQQVLRLFRKFAAVSSAAAVDRKELYLETLRRSSHFVTRAQTLWTSLELKLFFLKR